MLTPLIIIALLSPSPEADLAPVPDTPFSADDCEALFGDYDTWKQNTVRQALISRVEQRDGEVELMHSAQWLRIREYDFDGLELLDTRPHHPAPQLKGPPTGWLVAELDEALAEEAECPAGRYALSTSQSIGPYIRILAVLDDMVLIEHQRALGFVMTEAHAPPKWRLVWKSPFLLPRPSMGTSAVSSGSGAGRTSSTFKRRRPRRRSRRRR